MSRSLLTATSALSTALLLAVSAPAWAQSHAGHATTPSTTTADTPPVDGGNVDHSQMDHSTMDHAAMGHGVPKAPAPTEPLEPIPAVTPADRLAAFPPISHGAMEHAPDIHAMLLVNRLEHWDGQHGNGQAWEASGWLGGNINRVWLRSEGERSRGRTVAADLELLYGRSVSPWWDVLVGVKQDSRPADSRTWAAIGIQGLAPYKFETSATAYLGEGGQLAASVEVEYELLLTNRLILQPLMEASFSAKDEPEYGNGSGLNKVEAGLRLRYEFNRRFAPYIGISHERLFGGTADYHQAAGERARDTRWVAGVRVWF